MATAEGESPTQCWLTFIEPLLMSSFCILSVFLLAHHQNDATVTNRFCKSTEFKLGDHIWANMPLPKTKYVHIVGVHCLVAAVPILLQPPIVAVKVHGLVWIGVW